MDAIIGALDAQMAMSSQALNSETVRMGLKDLLLSHRRLWETLRTQRWGAPADKQGRRLPACRSLAPAGRIGPALRRGLGAGSHPSSG
jgi:hypothetical protein